MLQIFAGVHILAIIFYRLQGNHLTKAMITGYAARSDGFDGGLVPAGPVRLIVVLTISIALAWWISSGAPGL